MTSRACRSALAILTFGAALWACSSSSDGGGEEGNGVGPGGVGPTLYTAEDKTVPNFWFPNIDGMSDYIGAGGDSQQPPVLPRPSAHADRMAVIGDSLAVLALHWPSRTAELRVAPVSAPNASTGFADLSQLIAMPEELAGDQGGFFIRLERASLFGFESRILLVAPADQRTDVLVFDIEGGAPVLAGRAELPFGAENMNLAVPLRPDPPMGWPRVAVAGSTLVFQARRNTPTFEIVDLRTPSAIRHVATLERGSSDYIGPLRSSGNIVYSDRRVPVGASGEVAYFLDRVDVSDPATPRHLRSVNLPGPVIATQSGGRRLLAAGFRRSRVQGVTTCCPGAGGCASSAMIDTCEVTREEISLVELADDDSAPTLDSLPPASPLGLSALLSHDLGTFAVQAGDTNTAPRHEIVAIGDFTSGKVSLQAAPVAAQTDWSVKLAAGNTTHVAFAADYGQSVVILQRLDGMGLGAARVAPVPRSLDFAMTPDSLLVATGMQGIVSVPLAP